MPAENEVDRTTDGCARICGFFTLLLASTGVALSCFVVGSCDFLTFQFPDLPLPTLDPIAISSLVPTYSPTPEELSFGLFKFLSREDEQCYFYDNRFSGENLGVHQYIARLGGVLMVVCSLVGLCLMLFQFFCCRFYCAKSLVVTGFTIALLGIPMTFVLFFDPECRRREGEVYTCERGKAANQAIAASAIFITVLVMLCFTPSVVPVLRLMEESSLPNWQCFYCCSRSPFGKLLTRVHGYRKVGLTEDGENGVDMVEIDGGHTFKQYHDETAGLTYQNQHTAAYKRWLEFETDYEAALSRFKSECGDAEVDWRVFLRGARCRRKEMESFSDEVSGSHRAEDDEMYIDDELLRFVDILDALRANCNFAKEVMLRIQKDINNQASAEDARNLRGGSTKKSREASMKGGTQHGSNSPTASEVRKENEPEFFSPSGSMAMECPPDTESAIPASTFQSFRNSTRPSRNFAREAEEFTSARMVMNASLSNVGSVQQDGLSTRVNPSVMSGSQGFVEEGEEAEDNVSPLNRTRNPVAMFWTRK